ncbi:MAG TPA: PorV/PorQ family protein [Longimicrobiales bacterium]
MTARYRTAGCVLALLLLGAAPLGAQDGAGSSAAVLLQLAPAPRPLALGGAYTALGSDAYALFYNAAGLAGAGRAVGAAYHAYPVGVAAGSLAGVLPIGRLSLALGVHYLDLGEVQVLEPDPAYAGQRGRPTGETVGGGEVVASAGAAVAITSTLAVGVAGKVVHIGLAEQSDAGVAADVGASAGLFGGRLRVGAALQNLGPAMGPGLPSPLPRTIRAGAALELGAAGPGIRTTLAAEAVHLEGRASFATGLELGYRDGRGRGFLARAGFDARARERDAASPVTVGGGIALGRVRVDYAYRAVGPLGGTHHFGFALGDGT